MEPISSTPPALFLGLAAVLTLFPGVDAAVVLGAFAGALAFVTAKADIRSWKKVSYFLVAFVFGCLAAGHAAKLVGLILPASIDVSPGLGALFAAAVSVKLLLWLIDQEPIEILRGFRRSAGGESK